VTVEALAARSASEAPVAFDAVDAWRATRRPLAWIAAVCVSAAWVLVAAFIAHGRPAPVVVAAASPPPALESPALVTGSTASETLAPLPMPLPEMQADAVPAAPVASARTPAAPKGPHKAREIVRQADF
jgi:hypothetical protein